MLITILIAVALLLVLFLAIVGLRPSDFRIERSVVISAAPASIFAHVFDLRKAQAWSPWSELDPAAKYTFDGPPSGVGSTMHWTGNGKIGEGRQTIVESRPNELVRVKLEFMRPMESTAAAEYALQSQGSQTRVTWSMSGKNNFMFKAVAMVMNQDKMIGGYFEKGLASLKSLSEGGAKA